MTRSIYMNDPDAPLTVIAFVLCAVIALGTVFNMRTETPMQIELGPGEIIHIRYHGTDGYVSVEFKEEATTVSVNGELVHSDPFSEVGDEEAE